MAGCKETATQMVSLINNTGIMNVKEVHYIGQQKTPEDGYIRIKQAGSCDIKYYSGMTTQLYDDAIQSLNNNGWKLSDKNDQVAVFSKTVDGKTWNLTYALTLSPNTTAHDVTIRPQE